MSQSEELPGPVYTSWQEAMNDPELDHSKPFYIAPDYTRPAPEGTGVGADWTGWQEIGLTADGGPAFGALVNEPCPVCHQDDGRHNLAAHVAAGTLNTRPEEHR